MKIISIEVEHNTSLKPILPFLRRLARDTEVIELSGSNIKATAQDMLRLYRNLSAFPKLKVFKRQINYAVDTLVEQEYNLINQWLSRAQNKVQLYYRQRESCQPGFYRILKESIKCPHMTSLSLSLHARGFGNFGGIELDVEKSEPDDFNEGDENKFDSEDDYSNIESEEDYFPDAEEDEEDEEQENIPFQSEEEKAQAIRDCLAPFFRFHLFPNLQKLKLVITDECTFHFGLFVANGCQSLQKLSHLDVSFEVRPIDTKYFFEGLAYLPLLASFALQIPFMKEDEYALMIQFLQRQTQLTGLNLCIDRLRSTKLGYQSQNLYLENICGCLAHNHNIKNLSLIANHWTLESLSNGLKKIEIINQLEELEIEVIDNWSTSSISASTRVEGLCDFLKKQKGSLRSLKIYLSFVFEDVIIDSLIRAISELENLETLSFDVNGANISEVDHNRFFQKVFDLTYLKIDTKWCPSFSKTFFELDKMLRKLSKLSTFSSHFDFMSTSKEPFAVNSSKFLKSLTSIKSLKFVRITMPFLKESVEKHPEDAVVLGEMENILNMNIRNHTYESIDKIQEIASQLRLTNSLKPELIFYT